MIHDGLSYFTQYQNFLDLFGNSLVVLIGVCRQIYGEELYFTDARKNFMIGAMICIGLRAYSQLRIFKPYRVLIELIAHTLFDMVSFTSILLLIIFLMAMIAGIQ